MEIKSIDDQSAGTAYHVPQGSLIVYDPKKKSSGQRKEVDLREVAPSILKGFGQKIPGYMRDGVIEELVD